MSVLMVSGDDLVQLGDVVPEQVVVAGADATRVLLDVEAHDVGQVDDDGLPRVRVQPQLVHAGADQVLKPEAFALIRAALEKRSAAATGVEIHPGAEHSFMRPDLQRKEPANATASRLSWPQSVAFLDACLAPKS